MPAFDELKVHVEDPVPPGESGTLDGTHEAETPVGDDADMATVPAKPLRLARLMVEVLVEPALKVTRVGLAVNEKSLKVIETVAVWVSEPLVPVMVTVKVPAAAALHDRVAVSGDGGRVTLAGLVAVQVRPAGRGVSDKYTVPAKPFNAVTVIVDVADEPAFTAAGEVALIVKSTKVNVAVAV